MNSTLRSKLKAFIAACLYFSGVLRLFAALKLRKRAFVLMYHRVLPAEKQLQSFSGAGMFVTPETFEHHMRFVRRWCNPITLDRFISLRESGSPFPPRTCLITFDDGWLDNLHEALPILQRHGVPATVFITTGVIGKTGGFWQERLVAMLYRAWQAGMLDSTFCPGLGVEDLGLQPNDDAQHARKQIRKLVTSLKTRAPGEIRELVEKVERSLCGHGLDLPANTVDNLMTWDDIRRLQQSGVVTIGSHCDSHIPLTQLPATDVREELAASRARLEECLGAPIVALAFPNGDHDTTSCDLARACGYRVAFTTRDGLVTPSDDPHRLRRVSIHEGAAPTIPLLLCRATGVL